jgi:hydroxyacylglutathione hydrolase
MKIKQFEDKGLAHYSYAVLSECENKIVLIDPSRNIEPYLNYAAKHKAEIIGVIETHPHADFVSGHLELFETTGAVIYCSGLLGADYPHKPFDDGQLIELGNIKLKAINTPGHSPDSICIVLEHEGTDKAVFTGDTLFIGDCGRPDLRENAGNLTAKREELASQMYYSLRKLIVLKNDVLVYPAHGAGTLCGKALSDACYSTIGDEKLSNWSLQEMSEAAFVSSLLNDQPFIPKYFSYDVELNKQGAANLEAAISRVPIIKMPEKLNNKIFIVDTRPAQDFKKGHLPGSINIQHGGKFETWLGSIIAPEEAFYLTAENESLLRDLILRAAKIGYEPFIEAGFVLETATEKLEIIDIYAFKVNPAIYTIVDVRNKEEANEHPVFNNSVNIPLYELRERVSEIPFNRPIVVHCAGGYRSAAGSSIINNAFKTKTKVFDLGEAIKDYF